MPSIVDTSVHIFNNTMAAVPQISGTVGVGIALFDAVLVNGFDTRTATGLQVVNGVATLAYSGALHSASIDSVVEVFGGDIPALIGEQKVTAVGSGFIRFATNAPNATAIGTVTFRMAPAGWSKTFSDTNLAVYRSNDILGTRTFFRVDDTDTSAMRVTAWETMDSVSTGGQRCPTQLQMDNGFFWYKSRDINATTRSWRIYADTRGVYFSCMWTPGNPWGSTSDNIFYAGDYNSRKSGDPYSFVITGSRNIPPAETNDAFRGCVGLSIKNATSNTMYITRAFTGLGSSVNAHQVGNNCNTTTHEVISGNAGYSHMLFPNPGSNELFCTEVGLYSNGALRGNFPGILHATQDIRNVFSTGDRIAGTGQFVGKTLMAQRCTSGNHANSDIRGVSFFDVTGPWR